MTIPMDNVQRLRLLCDLMQEDGFCLEATQIRNWIDSLSHLALTAIDTMPLSQIHGLGIRMVASMCTADSQLAVRQSIDTVLREFEKDNLNIHAIA